MRALPKSLVLLSGVGLALALAPRPAAAQGACVTSADCRSGELCNIVTVSNPDTGEMAETHEESAACVPVGCKADLDCNADEMCASYGPGIPNKCVPKPDAANPRNESEGTALSGVAPFVQPPAPQAPPPAPPPPPQPPPTPEKPKPGEQKRIPKVYFVVKGNLDARTLARLVARMDKELQNTFGTKGKDYVLGIRSADEPPLKEPRTLMVYLVGGDEAPTDIWRSYGMSPSDKSNETLKAAFDPNSAVTGVTFNNVSIVSTDKATHQGEYGLSNASIHELGHGLVGAQCAGHPGTPECGGVMVEFPNPNNDLGFTPQFNGLVKQMYPLVIHPLPRYTAAWRAGPVDEVQLYGWTPGELTPRYIELDNQGWRLKLLTSYVEQNEVRYSVVFQPGSEPQIAVFGWTYPDFRAHYDQLWNEGWRLHQISTYVLDDVVRYSAVWQPGSEGEIQLYGWTTQDLLARYDELRQQGWHLQLLTSYLENGEVRYVAVFKPGAEQEFSVWDWKLEDFQKKYEELWKGGWRVKLLHPYVVPAGVRYSAVFKPGMDDELTVYGWSYEDYRAQYDKLWWSGWRLKSLATN